MTEAKKQGRIRWGAFLWRVVFALISGSLLFCSFPPLGSSESAWFAIIPLLCIAKYSSAGSSFRWGFATGLLFWLASISWLLRLVCFGGPVIPVGVGWILLSAYCALYMGAFLAVVSMLFHEREGTLWNNLGLIIVIPMVWVGFEYLRSVLITGFPWNALGISQYRNLAVIQVAEWGGVYAVSAVIMVMNTALALTGFTFIPSGGRRKARVHVELMAGLLICALCWIYGAGKAKALASEPVTSQTATITAIQPNIAQDVKWDENAVMDIYRELKSLTELALTQKPDLIIWPETAVPCAVETDPATMEFVQYFACMGSSLLVGSMEVERDAETNTSKTLYYNSSFLFDTTGKIVDRYRKQHLVVFGEYVPLDKVFPFLQNLVPIGVSCSSGKKETVFDLEIGGQSADEKAGSLKFSVLICFEDIIASLARAAVKSGARLIVNQTNDAWFDGSWAAIQHMSHCVFRCVENRIGAVRCANTGVTCFIDRTGLIDMTTRDILARKETSLTRCRTEVMGVQGADMPLTFYTKYGDIPFALPCGIMAILWTLMVILKNRGYDVHDR